MSTPPSVLARNDGRAIERSIKTLRYNSRLGTLPASINTLRTCLPCGPVWWVTSTLPISSRAAFAASSGVLTILDAARLAASAGVNLRLDGDGVGFQRARNCFRFFGRGRDPAVGDGHAEAAKDFLGLVFVDIHELINFGSTVVDGHDLEAFRSREPTSGGRIDSRAS
jgi:hypothetical protein